MFFVWICIEPRQFFFFVPWLEPPPPPFFLLVFLFLKVQELSDAVATTSGVRKGVIWPAISLSILIIIGFIVFGIGTYECVACGAGKCRSLSCLITPITVFLAVVIWIAAASAVSLSGEINFPSPLHSVYKTCEWFSPLGHRNFRQSPPPCPTPSGGEIILPFFVPPWPL